MRYDVEHGEHCDCMLLAAAVGAPASSVDYAYCHAVLHKHWRLRCTHGGCARPPQATPRLPALDWRDPLQAFVLANAPAA